MVKHIGTRRLAFLAMWMVISITSSTNADDPIQQYRQAASEYAQRHWKLAATQFRAFLRDHPKDSRATTARFFLAETLVQLGEFEQAHEQFAQFIIDAPRHRYTKQAYFRRGETSYLANRTALARKELLAFGDKFPEHPLNQFALSYLGELALLTKDYRSARRFYNECIRRYPKGARRNHCRLGLGRTFAAEGKLAAAKPFFENLVTQGQGGLKHEGQLRLGMLLFEQRRLSAAITQLRQLIKSKPQATIQHRAKYWLAKSLLNAGQAESSIDYFEQLPLGQLDAAMAASATLLVADAHRRLGNDVEARQWYRKIWSRHAASKWAAPSLIGQMHIALKQRDYDELHTLAQLFRKAFRSHPSWLEVRQLIGRSLIQQKRYEEAIVAFQDLVKSPQPLVKQGDNKVVQTSATQSEKSNGATNRYFLGLAQLKAGKARDSLVTLSKALLKKLPKSLRADVALTRAAAHVVLKEYRQAIAPLREYLATAPKGTHAARCRAQLVVMLAHDGQILQAHQTLTELERAHVKERGLWLEAALFLAESAYSQHNRALAVQLFTRLSAKGNPDKYVTQGIAGVAWAKLADTELAESATAFDDLLKRFPNSRLAPEAAVVRGNTLERLKQMDAALDSYLLVINKYPQARQLAAAQLGAGRLLAKRKQFKDASQLLQRVVKEAPKFSHLDAALYELAWVHIDTRQTPQANKLFARIHNEFPSSRYWADSTYRLAEQQAQNKQIQTALPLLRKLMATRPKGTLATHATYLLAQLHASTGDWHETNRLMRRIVIDHPLSPLRLSAEYWIAESQFRLGNYDAAADLLTQVERQSRGRDYEWLPMVPLRQAQIRAHKQDWTTAQQLAEQLISRHTKFSRNYEAHYLIGRCHAARGEYRQARTAYEAVIRQGRNTETAALAQWMIGESYFHQKKHDEAIEAYRKVVDVYKFPQWQAAALLQTGKCLEIQRHWKPATAAYAQLLKEYSTSQYVRQARTRLRIVRERATLASRPGNTIK